MSEVPAAPHAASADRDRVEGIYLLLRPPELRACCPPACPGDVRRRAVKSLVQAVVVILVAALLGVALTWNPLKPLDAPRGSLLGTPAHLSLILGWNVMCGT
ncbi:hypothetical protein [Streptomyces regalis]|uniref:hypothetical protein n=1 Tax=Streptomyces regalis TaxID=68262 RepID=UPI0024465E69|nr:hypothetical protein [Streptomyces regalis]